MNRKREDKKSSNRRKLTPNEIADRWGVAVEKVIAWIRNGELRAINVAVKPNGKPRYRIDLADLAAFENRRTVGAAPPKTRRRNTDPNVIEYF